MPYMAAPQCSRAFYFSVLIWLCIEHRGFLLLCCFLLPYLPERINCSLLRNRNPFLMHSHITVPLTFTDYTLQNLGYLFFINRLMRRLGHEEAAVFTKVCERTIIELEGGDMKDVKFDTLRKLADAYGYTPAELFFNYTTLPSPEEWKVLKAKSIALGNLSRCKDTPLPGSRAAKELDKEWRQWGEMLLEKFYERVRK